MKGLRFDTLVDDAPLYTNKTSALHPAIRRTDTWVTDADPQLFRLEVLLKKGGIRSHYVKTTYQLTDVGNINFSKIRQGYPIKFISQLETAADILYITNMGLVTGTGSSCVYVFFCYELLFECPL